MISMNRSNPSFMTRLKGWLLIFFLSLMPGLIFIWDWNPDGENRFREVAANQKWFSESEVCAERFAGSSEIEFWQKLLVKRFLDTLNRNLENSLPLDDALNAAWSAFRPEHFPEVAMHCFVRKNGQWQLKSFGKLPGSSEYLFRKLFAEMVAFAEFRTNSLLTSVWGQRIKTIFGHMVFPEQFVGDMKNHSFPVLIKGLPWSIVWDFFSLRDEDQIAGGCFFYFPGTFGYNPKPFELIMKNWNMVAAGYDKAFPVLMPILPGNQQIWIHQKIFTTELKLGLERFRRETIRKVPSVVPELVDKIRLPGEKMGAAFTVGGKLARICVLSPNSGYLGLLVNDLPVPEKPLRKYIAEAYFVGDLIIWLLFVVRACIFRQLPTVDLRFRVMAWFLAFAAFPAGLTIGAWSSLIQDFESYRISQIQKGLQDTLQSVEAGISELDNRFLTTSFSYMNQKDFHEILLKLLSEPDRENEMFDGLFAHYRRHNIELSGIMLVVQGGWYFTRFNDGALSQRKNSQLSAAASLFDQYLKTVDRATYERFRIPNDSANDARRIPSILSVGDLDVTDNFTVLSDCFDRVTDLRLEKKNFLQFTRNITHKGRSFALFVAYFELTNQIQKLFRQNLHREGLRFQHKWGLFPDLAVYQVFRQDKKLFEKTGNAEGLARIADYPVEKISRFFDGEYASVMMPSVRFPDFRYVARVTTANIKLLVAHEKGLIVFSVGAILLIIVLGSSLASLWISVPAKKFIAGLRQLRQGYEPELSVSNRNDELGVASDSLQRMSEWILERERLTKFVSPKVLQMVAGGNIFKAGAGSIQEVTVLVSDIRSFTTISETYSADKVFAMVNKHLQLMAKIIQEHSGNIDRFVGDAIWAVFFIPGEEGGKKALNAALAMIKENSEIQQQRKIAGDFGYGIGIGIHTGKVLAGVLGENSVRLDFSVVGEALQEAERLEGLSRNSIGPGIVFSENLCKSAEELGINFQKTGEESVYEVISVE